MSDFTHHTPRLLSEADAAADLAGVARPVSSDDVKLMAAKLDDMIANPWSASAMLLVLVSERDALASRVRELEAALGDVIVDCTHLHHAKKDRHSFSDPCPVERRIRAALTTPESKP